MNLNISGGGEKIRDVLTSYKKNKTLNKFILIVTNNVVSERSPADVCLSCLEADCLNLFDFNHQNVQFLCEL